MLHEIQQYWGMHTPAPAPPVSIAAPTTELSIAGIDFAKILEIAKNIPDPNPPPKVASQTTIDEERVSYLKFWLFSYCWF